MTWTWVLIVWLASVGGCSRRAGSPRTGADVDAVERELARDAVIGAILPLSGRGREIGESARQGLLVAAAWASRDDPSGVAPQVLFRDDQGDPALARQAVDELASREEVVAIVGPIASASARAAAEQAADREVPLIALSPVAQLGDAARGIFRLHPTPAEEVAALVEHAVNGGARRFALLHPRGGFGRALRAAYEAAVQERGGQVTHVRAYRSGQTSFGAEVEELAAAEFDALLIADAAPRVALIAPALSAAGLWSTLDGEAPPDGRAIQLLLPSVAFDRKLARTTRRYLQGAVFVAPFDPTRGRGAQLRAAFRAQFDAEPTQFSAFAHDAYVLVRAALLDGVGSRGELAEALPSVSAELASRLAGLSEAGGPRQGGALYVLRGRAFTPLGGED